MAQQPIVASINNVSDLSIKNIIPSSKPSNRGRSRTRGRGKRGRGRSASSASERPLNQVATPDTKHSDRSQSLPYSRFKESTLQKRRALNITSDEFVCFYAAALMSRGYAKFILMLKYKRFLVPNANITMNLIFANPTPEEIPPLGLALTTTSIPPPELIKVFTDWKFQNTD